MYNRYPYIFLSSTSIRCISTAINAYAKTHYDVLCITPKATQAEIKTAYYKLSKLYHPDKNQNSSDAATKFRDITTAYEVLSNQSTRKLYDKGVKFDERVYRHPAEDDDLKTKFYKSREHTYKSMGRTTSNNFDNWSRAPYGATFARDTERKRREQIKEEEAAEENQKNMEKIAIGLVFFMGFLLYCTSDHFDVHGNVNPKPP